MGVSFGRSRVADLTFQVFGKAIHPDWFTVRAHRRITQNIWEADIRIIEGGHSVIFRSEQVRVAEVLAGPETILPEPGLLFHSSVRNERSASLHPGAGLVYQTCFEVERVDPEVFTHLCDEMTLDARQGRLFHRFSPVDRMAPAPLTHLHVDARINGLSIQSFHTFPAECAIVRTQSLFEPRIAHPS